ncbi:MAG: SH3 domain-containing protein, partial [Treponema sp.]|nr:SH3 domain-containing protein [Treponema sp.]
MIFLSVMISLSFTSCTQLLGWGVLLWSSEDPAIPSGTLLPVYIRSNIDQVWVVGIPDEYREGEDSIDKYEVRLWELEFVGNKKAAEERAVEFAEYAQTYAETLQDGLPIRESPENNARRVYRLRQGQIIKVLNKTTGVIAVGASGDPLPGDWYRVLTSDGSIGYCFSYRLRLFDQTAGLALASPEVEIIEED